MITIELQRQAPKGKAVPGVMTLPLMQGAFRCETLENADFLIPAGTYPLKMTWSPRYKKLMPEICDVPEREGIRIIGVPENFNFWGERSARVLTLKTGFSNTYEGCEREHEHSTGCVLVNILGLEAVKTLFNQRLKWYDEKEMLIEIKQD